MSNNTYTYGIHTNLTPPQLFFLVMLDKAAKHFGVDELTGLALVIIG